MVGCSTEFFIVHDSALIIHKKMVSALVLSVAMSLEAWVLIFCVEFRELFHLIRDLSQAEKKINVVTS